MNQISQQEADTLERPFMEEEIHSALMDNSRPGWLDGGLLAILLGVCEGGGVRDVQGIP